MKPLTQATRARFILLCERSRDQPLPSSETAELNSLLKDHPELVKTMAESLLIDAELRRDPRLLQEMKTTPQEARGPRNIIPIFALGAAACLFLGLLVFQTLRQAETDKSSPGVAILSKSTNCRWASSTIPTAEGSHVPAGKLELVEGLATIVFDSGAEISLEAPATLEIIDKMNARLISGTLVADVPPTAIGFTIDTKDATITDLGTRFGLSTDEQGKYLVQVIEGLVEVDHKGENNIRQVTEGKSLDRGLLEKKKNPGPSVSEPTRWQPDPAFAQADGWKNVPTSFGKGRDTYVTSDPNQLGKGDEPFFRVKQTTIQPNLVRVGFLAFDISGTDSAGVSEAELILNIEPSDLGFASLVPDSEFTVYGLTDEAADNWSEKDLKWENAPALDPTMVNLKTPEPGKAVPLGKFLVPRGVQRGTRSISGSALADFIRSDTNGTATLIIFRDSDETAKAGLVQAFSSKENAVNPPPILRMKTD